MVWKGLGTSIILYLAGLQNIPRNYYEAASIDGANGWQKFRHITVPLGLAGYVLYFNYQPDWRIPGVRGSTGYDE